MDGTASEIHIPFVLQPFLASKLERILYNFAIFVHKSHQFFFIYLLNDLIGQFSGCSSEDRWSLVVDLFTESYLELTLTTRV